jgi:uncharacterized lipoprotein YehR (DUF1307 family)
MDIFTYDGSGEVGVSGGYAAFPSNYILYNYSIGEIVYVISNAAFQGKLTKVLISNVKIKCNNLSNFEPKVLYYDQYNWEYNQIDLCDFETAKYLAKLYYEGKIVDINTIQNIQMFSKNPAYTTAIQREALAIDYIQKDI